MELSGANICCKIERHKKIVFNALFFIFALRIFFLILVPPFIGIANNGDFQRLMLPLGLDYRNDPWLPTNYAESFNAYITNDFIFVPAVSTGWNQLFSIFPWIAIQMSNKIMSGQFDIRFLGVVNATFYLLPIYIFVRLIRKIRGCWSYLLLFTLLLILGDSYIVQYFNSFYTEIGTLSASLLLWVLLIYGFTTKPTKNKLKLGAMLVLDSTVALLAILCKQQDILTVIPITLIIIVFLRHNHVSIRSIGIWVFLFLGLTVGIFSNNEAAGTRATFNVMCMDILSNSEYPDIHLEKMNLSQFEMGTISNCIGSNSFTPDGVAAWEQLGDKFTRANELKTIIREPKILFKMIDNRSKNLFKDAPLGNYSKDSGAIPMEKTQENRLWSHIKEGIYRSQYLFYTAVLIITGLCIWLGLNNKFLSVFPKELFLLYAVLPFSNIIRFFSVILGDSSHDDIKHFFMLNIEFDIMFVTNFIIFIYLCEKIITSKLSQEKYISSKIFTWFLK